MNRFKKFVCFVIITEIAVVLICNGLYFYRNNRDEGRLYRVEANRIVREIEQQNLTVEEIYAMDLSKYETIVDVSEFLPNEACPNDYLVKEIDGRWYRIEYRSGRNNDLLLYVNSVLAAMILVTAVILFYVNQKVLKPFQTMSSLSYELAKGNLSAPVKEEKSKLFGHFLWGMDMLREKLEDNREKELELHRDRKTLILSLSHDIKTPLSSIEMYARALTENLYDTREKKESALRGITRNVKEIKQYVNEIVAASREDFLNLEVTQGELYLSEIIRGTELYYRDKLSVLHTELEIARFDECLIKGDKDRLLEVFQNIMENAIKYGDGRRIYIYGEDEEDCKIIHIENTGNSLKEEELPSLFDSFYRGSNSYGIKGNGLGLYICRTLMRKMEGDIFVQLRDGNFRASVVVRKA